MAKLTKQIIKCTCGNSSYNVVTTGDPLAACVSFKGRKCPQGTDVSVEVLETESRSSLLEARSDSKTIYDAGKNDMIEKSINGSYCVCRCDHDSETFKVYGCRQPGQTGAVCSQCCENACKSKGPLGVKGNYEITTDPIDLKNAVYVGSTILESGPDFTVRSKSDRSIAIDTNSLSRGVKVLAERVSKSEEMVFKAVARAISNYPKSLQATLSGPNLDNIEIISYETPVDLGDLSGGGGDDSGTGGCKDCGGGGGVLKQCVSGLGAAICIEVDPNIDIDWGWPPSGGLSGGTITITITF